MLLVCRNPECPIYFSKSKVKFTMAKLKFLGHVVGAEGCHPQKDKVEAVKSWPPLKTVIHVRQFLGLAGYYRKYIQGFSELAQPLTRLTKSTVDWTWGEKEQAAQDAIKRVLASAPVLALPDMRAAADGRAPFVVQTDASAVALGGVLMQDLGQGLRPIAFESRQFSPAEQDYGTGERELCALHHCYTVAWRHYLVFTEFKLQGDHRPLEWLMSPGRELSRRQARWYMDLVEVGVPKMEWIPGRMLQVPDALSRRPDYREADPREGLREAGMTDPTTDLPQDPIRPEQPGGRVEPSAAGTALPLLLEGKGVGEEWQDTGCLWLTAVQNLQWAENAWEAFDDSGHSAGDPTVAVVTRAQAAKGATGMDFVTGLPLTQRGYDAFVAFTCKLSKQVHIAPLNFGDSRSSQVVSRIYFDTVWKHHGAPMKIVSDRDPRFIHDFWQNLQKLMGVKVATTTPYNPRSDGQAGHTNRVIEDMLRSFVENHPEDWDLWCTNVEFAINDSRSESTGFTPFELVCPTPPMTQLDLFLEAALEDSPGARQRLEMAQQRQRTLFDERLLNQTYDVGSLVWVEARHLTERVKDKETYRKLGPRWLGPLPITERFFSDQQLALPEEDRGAPVAYRLKLPGGWKIHDVFAQHRLRPYKDGSHAFVEREKKVVPRTAVVDGQKEYYVDRILARRVRQVRGKEVVEWKVRWLGLTREHDQWRKLKDLEHGGPLRQLREFEEARIHKEAFDREQADYRRQQQRKAQIALMGEGRGQLTKEEDDWTRAGHPLPGGPLLPHEVFDAESHSYVVKAESIAVAINAQRKFRRPPRILVLFSGTGSVEQAFVDKFADAEVVTVDQDPRSSPTHACPVEKWDEKQYPRGYFDGTGRLQGRSTSAAVYPVPRQLLYDLFKDLLL
eukprot:gene8612-biopygen8743